MNCKIVCNICTKFHETGKITLNFSQTRLNFINLVLIMNITFFAQPTVNAQAKKKKTRAVLQFHMNSVCTILTHIGKRSTGQQCI